MKAVFAVGYSDKYGAIVHRSGNYAANLNAPTHELVFMGQYLATSTNFAPFQTYKIMAKEKSRKAGFEEGDDEPVASTITIGKSYMLGIGINQYLNPEWPRLNNAVNDIESVAALLGQRYNFDEIRLVRDGEVTRDRLEEELYRYTDEAVLGADDSLLIYYSGHGHLDKNDKGYWVPVGAKKGAIASYLPNSRILELISDMKARHVLLVSDSCYSGSLFTNDRSMADTELVASELEKRKSRWAICSGREDQKVSDGSGKNSPFTEAMLQELTVNESGKINISRIAEMVMAITRSNKDQLPNFGPISGNLGGQFVFTLKNYKGGKIKPPVTGGGATSRGGKGRRDDPAPPVASNIRPTERPIIPTEQPQPTSRKELYDAIQALLAQQMTLDGIQLILNFEDPGLSRVRDTAVLLSGRWNALLREERDGSIGSQEATLGKNKITAALQDLAKDIYKPSTVSEIKVLQTTLRNQISMARTDEAIKTLKNLSIPEWTNDMRLALNTISSEWETLKREEMLGVSNPIMAGPQRNNITMRLLILVDNLKAN